MISYYCFHLYPTLRQVSERSPAPICPRLLHFLNRRSASHGVEFARVILSKFGEIPPRTLGLMTSLTTPKKPETHHTANNQQIVWDIWIGHICPSEGEKGTLLLRPSRKFLGALKAPQTRRQSQIATSFCSTDAAIHVAHHCLEVLLRLEHACMQLGLWVRVT